MGVILYEQSNQSSSYENPKLLLNHENQQLQNREATSNQQDSESPKPSAVENVAYEELGRDINLPFPGGFPLIPEQSSRPGSPVSVLDLDWDSVSGLEKMQLSALHSVATAGVVWKNPITSEKARFTLHYGGEVESDGNCLFTAASCILGDSHGGSKAVRHSVVEKFLKDYYCGMINREKIDESIKNLYSPALSKGWGVHVVQEVKILVEKRARASLDTAICELQQCGLSREAAAESVFKERGIAVEDGSSWGKFMRVSGNAEDEHDIVTFQYIEEGLLSVEENPSGSAAAFGDDIAIETLATLCGREIFVMQAHGSDAMVDEENCLFFLPHNPRTPVENLPMFLFMKGTGWCGGGADHYEPIVLRQMDLDSKSKPAVVL